MHFPVKYARGHNKKYQEDDEKSQEQPPSISPLRGDRMLALAHGLGPDCPQMNVRDPNFTMSAALGKGRQRVLYDRSGLSKKWCTHSGSA